MLEESIAIANVIPERAVTVILDERGESLEQRSFAGHLQALAGDRPPAVVFIIGGADGLAPSLREQAELALAFGAATWPHQLVRIMLLEQIYRAVTILSGHPYHRGLSSRSLACTDVPSKPAICALVLIRHESWLPLRRWSRFCIRHD